MPYTLKIEQVAVKDPQTGEYTGVDVLAEQTKEGLIAELQAEGARQQALIVADVDSAEENALKAEGFAVGEQDGTAVGSTSPYYHNNAEYFRDQATSSAMAASGSATAAAGSATAAATSAAYAQAFTGAPRVAATAAAMTDTDLIYVYTGSESGYTAGNWYYYNGSAWASGGVYNSGAVNVDATLAISGAAADAAACGAIKSALNWFRNDLKPLLVNGYIAVGSLNIGDTVDFTPQSGGYKTQAFPCSKGDIFIETGYLNANNPRLWAFTDSDKKLLSKCENQVTLNNTPLEAPADGYAIFSFLASSEYELYKVVVHEDSALNVTKFINFLEQGTIVSNGQESSSSNRIRTDFIPINGSKRIKIELPSLYTFSYSFYGDITLESFISQAATWQVSPIEILPPINAKYIRLVVRYANNSDLSELPINTLNVTWFYTVSERLNQHNYNNGYIFKAINHRGFNVAAPENTLPAFALSKKMGFEYVEFDVQFTSDNVPVILHDGTINRTARNADGSTIENEITISSITYAQALQYDFGIWKGNSFAGTKIPTLEEVLKLCKELSLKPCIELKNNFSVENTQNVANIIAKLGMEKNVIFVSFTFSYLERMYAHCPNASFGLSFSQYSTEDVTTKIENIKSLKNNDNVVFVIGSIDGMTNELYELVKAENIPILQWIVNKSNYIPTLQSNCIAVFTDHLNVSEVMNTYYMNKTLS